ncbi:MAG: type II secretion system F family protein [Arenicella sp.]
MSLVNGILILALIAAGALFLGIKEYLYKSYTDYEARSVKQIKSGLADNLLFMDPQKLFIFTLGLTFVVGVVIYFIYNAVIALLVMVFAAFLPKLILKFLKKRRDDKFIYQLPDCLSAVAMSLRAGSNLSRAMELIVEQQPAPISQEFAIVVSDIKMGKQMDDALDDMYNRVESIEVELFTSAVSISRSVGGNLANTVETLADTIRERLKIEGKIKALTAMGKAQGWVIGLMPFLVIYALYRIEPEAMSALTNEPAGWAVSAFLFIMSIIAFMIVRKIITIDV